MPAVPGVTPRIQVPAVAAVMTCNNSLLHAEASTRAQCARVLKTLGINCVQQQPGACAAKHCCLTVQDQPHH